MRWLGPIAALCALAACASDGGSTTAAPIDVQLRVEWLRDPTAMIPTSVDTIRLLVYADGGEPLESFHTVSHLTDENRNGRLELVRSGLPVGVPFRIRVEGRGAGVLTHVSSVGPITLAPGERRYVSIQMYPVGTPFVLPDAPVPGVLHTATALPDGRVLIAGGFRTATRAACPPPIPAVEQRRCFDLSAATEAHVFDPGSGMFYPVRGGMLEARGGHTATVLPGGRVLVAGGAPRALLILEPQLDPAGFGARIVPQDTDGTNGALATFEVFDPTLNAETMDVDRNGDPARGGFIGAAADPARPGTLNAERFMHAAATVPGDPARVLLAGGIGPAATVESYELYDDRRPGGYGVYSNGGAMLQTPRITPSAIAAGTGRIWIFGGTFATQNEDLAEIWTPSAPTMPSPNGSTTPAAGGTSFPSSTGTAEDHPDYSLLRPNVAPLAGGSHALVVGWLGARCNASGVAFSDDAAGAGTAYCDAAATRNFTVDGMTGRTARTMLGAEHAFAASAVLDDGTVVVTGGIRSLLFEIQDQVDVLTGMVSSGAAQAGMPTTLANGRFLHETAAVWQRGMLTTGGAVLSADVSDMTLVAEAEIYFF